MEFGKKFRYRTRRKTEAATKIQRFYRRLRLARELLAIARDMIIVCPITLCVIGPGRAFRIGKHTFDADALANYIEESADFRCPLTRVQIAPHLLMALENKTGKRVWSKRAQITQDARERNDVASLHLWYQRNFEAYAGDIIMALLDEAAETRAVMTDVTEALKSYANTMMQYTRLDRARALTVIGDTERAIEGVTTFHVITKNIATRFLAHFRRTYVDPPPPPPPSPRDQQP